MYIDSNAVYWIDAGHGGHDSGAIGNGLREKDLVLDISLKEASILRAMGKQVKLTRSSDVFVPLSTRVARANENNACIFISNHINSGGGKGYECWHSLYSDKGQSIASNVNAEIPKFMTSRGLKTKKGRNGDFLYVLRATKMPAILNEFGFIDNANDMELLKQETFRWQLAHAVVKGVCGRSTAATPKPITPTGTYGECTASALNVRNAPSTGGTIIGKLYRGEKVKLYRLEGNWWHTYFGNHGGYVSAQYIKTL